MGGTLATPRKPQRPSRFQGGKMTHAKPQRREEDYLGVFFAALREFFRQCGSDPDERKQLTMKSAMSTSPRNSATASHKQRPKYSDGRGHSRGGEDELVSRDDSGSGVVIAALGYGRAKPGDTGKGVGLSPGL